LNNEKSPQFPQIADFKITEIAIIGRHNRLVGILPKVVHAPKTAAHKKHSTNTLRNEKHSHGIALALPKLNIAFDK